MIKFIFYAEISFKKIYFWYYFSIAMKSQYNLFQFWFIADYIQRKNLRITSMIIKRLLRVYPSIYKNDRHIHDKVFFFKISL